MGRGGVRREDEKRRRKGKEGKWCNGGEGRKEEETEEEAIRSREGANKGSVTRPNTGCQNTWR